MKEKGRENRAEEKTNGIAEKAGMQEQMRQTGKELLLLLRCALNGKAAGMSWDGEEWKRIWQLAKRSNVEAALWPAVKPHEETLPETLRSLWKQAASGARTARRRHAHRQCFHNVHPLPTRLYLLCFRTTAKSTI